MASSKINIDLVLNTKGFRPLGRINGQLGEFEKSLDASNARVLAFGASAGAILVVRKAFTATVKSAIEVERALTDINVILRATSSGLRKFGSELFQVASQTGQSFAVAAEAAGELARQGLGLTETLKRTRDALILSRLAGMDAVEAVNALTAAMNTFNQAGLDSTVIINKLANVDAAFAVSSDDLAKAIGRVGASAKAAGVSFDELLAIVTVAQQKTARGGAVIGNSFKTIFTRIQRPRVIKELENLGVAVKDVTGDVLPAMKVLSNLAKTFDVLTAAQRSSITELVGGVFQVNILKAAMSDLSSETGIYGRALQVANDSTDQALRRNEALNQTLSAQFNKTVNTFKEAAAELGTLTLGPAMGNLFKSVGKIEHMGKTPMGKVGTSIAKSIFEGIGKFISGPGLMVVGLVLFKTFSQLGKFAADAFKTLTGLNRNLSNQMSLQRQIFDVLSENPDLMRKIEDGTISVEEAHGEIYKQIEKNTGALDKQLTVSNALASSLSGGGVMFSPDFGATTGGTRDYGGKKGKSFGYVPNFMKDREELMGMVAGGYSKQQISSARPKDTTIHDGRGGSFSATVNAHESVINTRNQGGKKATFVVPPKGTDAYEKYMSVLSGGFVPNFNDRGSLLHQLKGVKGAKGLVDPARAMLKHISSAMNSGVFNDKEGTKAFVKEFKGKFPQSGAHEAGIRHPGATAYNSAIGAIGGLNRQRSPEARTKEAGAAMSRLGRITPGNIKKARKEIAGEYSNIRKDAGLTKGIAKQKFDSADFSSLLNVGSASNRMTLSVQGGVLRANEVRQHQLWGDPNVGNISVEEHNGKQHVVLEDMSSRGPVKFPSAFKGPLMQAASKYRYPTITRSKLTREQATGKSKVAQFRSRTDTRSGGFFPNFGASISDATKQIMAGKNPRGWNSMGLTPATKAQARKNSAARKKAGPKKSREFKVQTDDQGRPYEVYEMGGAYGLFGLQGSSSSKGVATAPTSKITAFSSIPAKDRPPGVHMKGVQYKALAGLSGKAGKPTKYSGYIRDFLGEPFRKMSVAFANKEMGIPTGGKGASAAQLNYDSKSMLFPSGAEGSMFEATINSVVKNKKLFDEGLGEDENKPFDFSDRGSLKKFREFSGFTSALRLADAKRTINKKSKQSLVNKIFNQSLASPGAKPRYIKDLIDNPHYKGKALGFIPSFNILEGYPEDSDSLSRGFIPNFNALWEAARREKSGGIPAAKIRVGQSDRLKNGGNPGGYGIYNTRDEPMGLNQGINSSMAAGIDPKKKGMARGFIPSFAKKGEGGLEAALDKNTKASQNQGMSGMKTIMMMGILQQGITGLNNAIGENSTILKSFVGSIGKMATMFIAIKYAMDQLNDSMGLKGKDRGLLGGKKDKERVASEGEFFKKKRADANKSYKEDMTRAREIDKKAGLKRSDTRAGRGTAESQKIQRKARRKRARSDIMYGKGAGRGPLGASGKGGGMMGGLMKGGLGRLAGGAGLAYGAVKGIGHMATKTDLSSTFKEQRLAAKAYEKIAAETEKNIGHLTKYGEAAQRAADVINDTNSSVGQVMQANQKLADAMKELPSKFKSLVAGEFDVSKIQAAIEVASEDQAREAMNAQARTDAATTLERNRDSTGFDFMASPLSSSINWLSTLGTEGGANIKGLTDEERKFSSKENVKQGEQVVTRLNQDSLRKADLQRTFMETAAEGTDTEADRMRQAGIVSSGLRMSDEDRAITMKQAKTGGDSWDEFLKGLQEAAVQDQANLRIAREMAPALKAMQIAVKKEEMAVRDHAEALKREQTVRLEVLKVTEAAAGAFLTSVGKIELATETKKVEAKQAISEKFAGQTLNVRTARTKASEAFTATPEMGALGADIEAILTKAETKGVGGVVEGEANAAIEGVAKRIQELKDIAADQDTEKLERRDAKAQLKQLEGLEVVLQGLHGNSEKGLKEQKAAVEGIDKVAEAQKLAARQERRLKSFGGASALLDPSKLNPMLKQIRGGQQAQIAAQRGGSQMGMDRGRLNELKGMQDLFGGELPADLNREAVGLAEKTALVQMTALNKQTGGHMTEEFIQKAAKEQAANFFKGSPIDENTGALDKTRIAVESLTAAITGQEDVAKASREDPASIGRKSADAAKNKDTAVKTLREMLKEEREGREGFADDIISDVEHIGKQTDASTMDEKYRLPGGATPEGKKKAGDWRRRAAAEEIYLKTGAQSMGGRRNQKSGRWEGSVGPKQTITTKKSLLGVDWLRPDSVDTRRKGVVFDPEAQALDIGRRATAATSPNPYSQAQYGRGGNEDHARFAGGEMFDPTFSQRSKPAYNPNPELGPEAAGAGATTTNNNTAEVHFNITSAGHVQTPGGKDMFFISREQWENIDRAVAEGKKKSEAIIKSIEGTDAGDRFLRMNVPLANLPPTSE